MQKWVGRSASQVIWLAAFAGLILPGTAMGHSGGTPRLTNEQAGPYRVYAWTQPEPLRAGEAHVSIAVTEVNENATAGSGQVESPVTDVDVTVQLVPVDASGNPTGEPIVINATHDSLLNDIYYEADTVIPAQGEWRVMIEIAGEGDDAAQTEFGVEVLPARQTNWTLVIGGGALLLLLLGLAGLLSRRQAQQKPARRSRQTRRRSTHRPVT